MGVPPSENTILRFLPARTRARPLLFILATFSGMLSLVMMLSRRLRRYILFLVTITLEGFKGGYEGVRREPLKASKSVQRRHWIVIGPQRPLPHDPQVPLVLSKHSIPDNRHTAAEDSD